MISPHSLQREIHNIHLRENCKYNRASYKTLQFYLITQHKFFLILDQINVFHHSNYDSDLEAAEKLSNSSLKIEYDDTMLPYLESILKVIQNRTYQIKNAIEFMRFNAGMG